MSNISKPHASTRMKSLARKWLDSLTLPEIESRWNIGGKLGFYRHEREYLRPSVVDEIKPMIAATSQDKPNGHETIKQMYIRLRAERLESVVGNDQLKKNAKNVTWRQRKMLAQKNYTDEQISALTRAQATELIKINSPSLANKPTVICSATSKTSGVQCKGFAIKDGLCDVHYRVANNLPSRYQEYKNRENRRINALVSYDMEFTAGGGD